MYRVSLFLTLTLCVFLAVACARQSSAQADQYCKSAATKVSTGDLEGALSDYNKAVELDSRNSQTYASRGNIRRLKADLDGAIDDFDQALKLDPTLKDAYNNRGVVRQARGDLDGAIADFTRALKIDANFGEAYHNRGMALSATGKISEAIADYTKSIAAPPHPYLSDSYNCRGVARKNTGDTTGATADFTKAIESAPNHIEAHINRGIILILSGKDSKAQKDFDFLLSLSPNMKTAVEQTIENAKKERAQKVRGPRR